MALKPMEYSDDAGGALVLEDTVDSDVEMADNTFAKTLMNRDKARSST